MSLVEAARSGDRLAALEALRDVLADSIGQADRVHHPRKEIG